MGSLIRPQRRPFGGRPPRPPSQVRRQFAPNVEPRPETIVEDLLPGWSNARVESLWAEVRRDLAGANQGKLRAGLAVTAATIVVTASGWPHGDPLQQFLFWVLVAIPSACVGMGLAVGELIQARQERRGERQADDREVAALRAKIREDVRSRPYQGG